MPLLLDLFCAFFRIGLFTFGGGYAMLPLIQESVSAKGWLAMEELVDFVAVSESTPGPFAINIATYVGMETGGVFGAVCATLGVVMPSFIVILIVARFYQKFKSSRIVSGVMTGLKPAVVGLIGATVVSIALTVFFPDGFKLMSTDIIHLVVSFAIFAVSGLMLIKKVHPIIVIVLSAALGIAAGYAQALFV